MNARMTAARISNLSLSLARAAVEDTRERTRARERSVRSFVRSVRPFRPFGPFRPSVRPSVAHCAPSIEPVRRPLDPTRSRAVGRRDRSRRSVGRRDRRDRGGRSSRSSRSRRSVGRDAIPSPIPPSTSRERSCFVLLSVSSSIHPFVPRTLLVVISAEWYYSRVRTHPWVRPASAPPALLRGNDVLEGALSLCLHIRAKVNPKVNPK